MPNMENHGGRCCGARHISGFCSCHECYGPAMFKELEQHTDFLRVSRLLGEIVLNNEQLEEMPELVDSMLKLGWRRVSVWYNGNSGNVCNMFIFDGHTKASGENTLDLDTIRQV